MNPHLLPLRLGLLLAVSSPARAADTPALAGGQTRDYVRDASVWRTPPIRPEGFQFEIQISSLGNSYDPDRVRTSIRGHNLGEYESKSRNVAVHYHGPSRVTTVRDIKNRRDCALEHGTDVELTLPPGEIAILEYALE